MQVLPLTEIIVSCLRILQKKNPKNNKKATARVYTGVALAFNNSLFNGVVSQKMTYPLPAFYIPFTLSMSRITALPRHEGLVKPDFPAYDPTVFSD
jgi:hypothetical protein